MSHQDIDAVKLPNLLQLVDILKRKSSEIIAKRDANGHIDSNMEESWHSINMEYYNHADEDKFIVVQTQKRRHTLKPNLRNCGFIYRGQRKEYPHILSSFARDEYDSQGNPLVLKQFRPKHLRSNLLSEDFIALLLTNPLSMMFDRGIILEPEKRPFFINMNYYGLAQHYGFKTGVVDFTTDINVAAFFASTISVGYDKYRPLTDEDIKANPVGVIYVHLIIPDLTFKPIFPFTTIGLQIYPRSGAQKGILFNEGTVPIEECVLPFRFRQEVGISKFIFERMHEGSDLFPKDSICMYAKEILEGNDVSGLTFAQNMYSNQDNLDEILSDLKQENIHVNWHKRMYFTHNMLHDFDQDLKNGMWEQFCNQIYFGDSQVGKKMHESLLNLPKNPAYQAYFNINEYPRLTYYWNSMDVRAKRNEGHKMSIS